jgi:hypothetical protein
MVGKNETKANFEVSMSMDINKDRESLFGIMVKGIKGNFIKT